MTAHKCVMAVKVYKLKSKLSCVFKVAYINCDKPGDGSKGLTLAMSGT